MSNTKQLEIYNSVASKVHQWIKSLSNKDFPLDPGGAPVDHLRLVNQIIQYELEVEIMAIVCKRWTQIRSGDGLIWSSTTPHPEIILHGTPALWSFIFTEEPQLKKVFEMWKKHLFAEYAGDILAPVDRERK